MEFPLKMGDLAVVRVDKGEDLGRIVHLLDRLPEYQPEVEYEVLRRATPKDVKTLEEYRQKENDAKITCKEKIENHGLEMKLVDVEYQFDGRKLTFFFTADGRIDFRQLVKDLAATFRTRIELKQIGARDETRRFGGLGPCGQSLCCAAFIVEFCPITTQMAKDQNLPLNPNKISGCCGRLKCCLKHELDEYIDALEELPRWDTKIMTGKGPATIEKLDVFNRFISLRYDNGDVEKVDLPTYEKLLSPDFKPQEAPSQQPESPNEINGIISDNENDSCTDAKGAIKAKQVKKRYHQDRHQASKPKGKASYSHQSKHQHNRRNNHKNDSNRQNHKPKS
ncbi:hypothetical protein CEE37_00610 [candidate division LCP-89 bacterium B3_LCP]|uniref:PSP1 C-terminal domain-containing protein n=1 Tax=candidate division LCP-89 bacterium B3_LCP TaxID=2012998 RepID=A0A532V5W8_UNCL8|nr:MAG: hypothetical protein CEE37_00610 [candidate division LCP-89 bacterium B3_LCP]